MIFNPLFLNEISADPKLLQKRGKLSSKKYLFTDIVKVVMEKPNDINNKLSIDNNPFLTSSNENIPIKLNSKELSSSDSENVKLGLAQILPIEIAQILIDDKITDQDPEPVSYISTDLLNGELKNFVYNLVNPEILEKNITNENGLLLSLEDNKSAVNIELSKAVTSSNKANKILVQTLVVPEKSKLFSFLGEGENSALFKVNDDTLNSTKQGDFKNNNQNIVKEQGDLKPTLSVYTFKYASDKSIDNLGEFSKQNILETNLKLLRNKELLGNKNVGTENKIDQLNSKLSKINLSEAIASKTKNKKPNLLSKIDLVKDSIKQVANKDNTFNINKITILKKQTSANSIKKENINRNEKSKLKSIKFKTNLPKTNNQIKSDLKVVQKQNLAEKTIQNNNNIDKIQNADLLSKIRITQSKSNNADSIDKANNKEKQQKIKSTSKNEISVQKNTASGEEKNKTIRTTPTSKIELNEKTTSSKSIENNESKLNLEVENNKVTNKIESLDIKKTTPINKQTVDNQNEKIKEFIKKDSTITKEEVNNKTKATELNNLEKSNVKSTSDKTNTIPTNDQESKSNKNVTINNIKVKENINYGEQTVTAENKNSSEQIAETQNRENKKVSVKMKTGVKGIREGAVNNASINDAKKNTDEKNSQSNDENAHKHSKSKQTIHSNVDINKNSNEFVHAFEKSNHQLGNASKINKPKKIYNKHFIKSTEVIKEVTKFISKAETGSLSFDIKPEELGKMKITLDTVDHVLKARIEVESEQAKQLIERNMDKLTQELNKNGVQLNSLNISLGNSNKKGFNSNRTNGGKKNDDSETWREGEIEEQTDEKSMGYNTYEYIA